MASMLLSPMSGNAVLARDRDATLSDRKPTIDQVETRIDILHRRAEIASEDANAASEQLKAANQRLTAVTTHLTRQRDRVDLLRRQLVGGALADYQTSPGLSASLLGSDDPVAFLRDLANLVVAQNRQVDMFTELTQQQRRLGVQEARAEREVGAVSDKSSELTDHQARLDDLTEQAQDVLASLRAEQRQRLLALQRRQERLSSASAPTPQPSRDQIRVTTTSRPSSDRAQVAVDTALAQVGDPYVYGAAGPDSFDCSGLTMYAWAAAGVSIPHASSMQPGAGSPVSITELMPGDLVFYYSPISHVGMYIGNGQIVHAPHPGSVVEVVPLNSMPIAMAVRIG